jgi:hypothetical protein
MKELDTLLTKFNWQGALYTMTFHNILGGKTKHVGGNEGFRSSLNYLSCTGITINLSLAACTTAAPVT